MLLTRSRGREIVLKILFQAEWEDIQDVDMAITEYVTGLADEPLEENDPATSFAKKRLKDILACREELDDLIRKNSSHWKLDRMACVDRNILRLGVFELCRCHDIPPKVAINEAVELAKKFGTDESGAFINGILDAILRSTGRNL